MGKTWDVARVAGLVAKLQLAGYKVQAFGSDGWACEVEGTQIFRASNNGTGRYDVKLNERVFLDV